MGDAWNDYGRVKRVVMKRHILSTILFGLSNLLLFLAASLLVFSLKGQVVRAAPMDWREIWCAREVVAGGTPYVGDIRSAGIWWSYSRSYAFDKPSMTPGKRCADANFINVGAPRVHVADHQPGVASVTGSWNLSGMDMTNTENPNYGFVTAWQVYGVLGDTSI